MIICSLQSLNLSSFYRFSVPPIPSWRKRRGCIGSRYQRGVMQYALLLRTRIEVAGFRLHVRPAYHAGNQALENPTHLENPPKQKPKISNRRFQSFGFPYPFNSVSILVNHYLNQLLDKLNDIECTLLSVR